MTVRRSMQESDAAADPNWNPQIREPKVETPDEQETQWLPREPPIAGGWIAPDERPPMSPGAWSLRLHRGYPRTSTQPSQGLALASMIVGLAGILLSWCLGPVPGIVALVLGLVALSQIKKSPDKFGGKPIWRPRESSSAQSASLFTCLLVLWVDSGAGP